MSTSVTKIDLEYSLCFQSVLKFFILGKYQTMTSGLVFLQLLQFIQGYDSRYIICPLVFFLTNQLDCITAIMDGDSAIIVYDNINFTVLSLEVKTLSKSDLNGLVYILVIMITTWCRQSANIIIISTFGCVDTKIHDLLSARPLN